MRILLFTPPLTQFNTPYPATAYLKSYLNKLGHETRQVDLSLELILKIFNQKTLGEIFKILCNKKKKSQELEYFLDAKDEYLKTIDEVIHFLQSGKSSKMKQIAQRKYLPEGPHFLPLDENQGGMHDLFREHSESDQARHIASLYLDDLAKLIENELDPDFGFSRYAEKISISLTSFTPLYQRMQNKTFIDELIEELVQDFVQKHEPDVVGLTVPFPGNLLGALRIAETVKKLKKNITVVMGGGYVNTELRELSDPRLFEFIDYLIFDDGEKPFELLLKKIQNQDAKLLRTMYLENNKVKYATSIGINDEKFKNLATPDFSDLDMSRYVSMMETMNVTQRLWSDYKWNKMILAHGCYWKKCTFCDVSLDYIGRFESDTAKNIVDKMEEIIKTTGITGFHFVDEAAPPAVLKSMSQEILKRKLKVSWWGNIRFDPFFTDEVTSLMSEAGCIAVTGGIEVASPRVLALIDKGISIEQVAKVTKNFKENNIFVHAYLMYGFPTQTVQETIDSLEVVRQLFMKGYLSSAYWHRFALTVHSPVAQNPDRYKIKILQVPIPKEGLFAKNEIPYTEEKFVDHEMLGVGLKRALYNYMLGIGFDLPLPKWFDKKVPHPDKSIEIE